MIATVGVGRGPSGVSFSPDGKRVLVANTASGTVVGGVRSYSLAISGKGDVAILANRGGASVIWMSSASSA